MEGAGPGGGEGGARWGGAQRAWTGWWTGSAASDTAARRSCGPYVLNYFSKQMHPGVKKPPGSSRRKEKEREGERRKAVLRVYLRDDLVSAQRINARLCLSLIKP